MKIGTVSIHTDDGRTGRAHLRASIAPMVEGTNQVVITVEVDSIEWDDDDSCPSTGGEVG